MKVGMITFHFVNNFGGALQAYALSEVISELANEKTLMIDYKHNFIRFTDFVRLFPITKNVSEIGTGICTMKERVGRLNKFKQFQIQYFNCSKSYSSVRGINSKPPKCDVYVCGSDQIWNPIVTLGVASPYYLQFVQEGKKVSYAASFGISNIPEKYRHKMRQYIKSCDLISVREAEGTKIVSEIAGIEAEQMIDPTLLISKEQWNQIAVEPNIDEPYILVYIMQQNDEVYKYAKRIDFRFFHHTQKGNYVRR